MIGYYVKVISNVSILVQGLVF